MISCEALVWIDKLKIKKASSYLGEYNDALLYK